VARVAADLAGQGGDAALPGADLLLKLSDSHRSRRGRTEQKRQGQEQAEQRGDRDAGGSGLSSSRAEHENKPAAFSGRFFPAPGGFGRAATLTGASI
jgi:hypothetical protein